MARSCGDVPAVNRPGSVPIATASGYGGGDRPDTGLADPDERYNNYPITSHSTSNQIKFIRYTRSQNTNRKLENKDIKRT